MLKSRSDKLHYLASPYTDPDPRVKEARFHAISWVAYHLLTTGTYVYSPIVHNIPIDRHGIAGNWVTWHHFDHLLVSRCDGLLICQLPGWEESKGIAAEHECATRLGIPIDYFDPPLELMKKDIGQEVAHAL